jgi:hypothetical protein
MGGIWGCRNNKLFTTVACDSTPALLFMYSPRAAIFACSYARIGVGKGADGGVVREGGFPRRRVAGGAWVERLAPWGPEAEAQPAPDGAAWACGTA